MTHCGRSGIASGNRAIEGTSLGTSVASSVGAAGDVTDQNEGTSSIGRSDSARVSAAVEDTSQKNESQSSSSTSSEIGENSITGGRLGRKKRGVAGSESILSNKGGVQAGSFLSQSAMVDAEYEFLAIYMGLPERDRMAVGHDFEGMFKQYIFEGVDCLDERYILCIIFLP